MLTYPDLNPVAIAVGSFQVHWYGLMYLIGFVGGWWLGMVRAKRSNGLWESEEIADLLFYIALGVVLGGRIGYVIFYGFSGWIQDPLVLFRIWQGGMSFHGGLLGVFLACWLYARKTQRTFFQLTDYIAPFVTIGLGAGRIGNFINGELWGRPTDLPWGMVFPFVDAQARHPSMLYEAILEGPVLFMVLWIFSAHRRPIMAVSGLFLICYGTIRFLIEFVREPDAHLGFIAFGWLTMGQLLSLPMIIIGMMWLWWAYRHPRYPQPRKPAGKEATA